MNLPGDYKLLQQVYPFIVAFKFNILTNFMLIEDRLAGLVVSMSTDHEVAGSIPGTSTNLKWDYVWNEV